MGNSKNKKVLKKRNALNNCQRKRSDLKENVPKNEKTKTMKHDPNDGIEMSKQLLMKKTNVRTQRRSSSKPARICPNGKPLPSLSELEKMYEDSDDDDDDLLDVKSPKNPSQNPTCITPTPEQQTPTSICINNLHSPSTIDRITKRLLGSIEEHNLPDPSELMNATSLLRGESPPPAPIIPSKKRQKSAVPYIVGCKDRAKVICKPYTNFCKGDNDYGLEAPGNPEEEEDIPRKRNKKSRIPNYMTREDAGAFSDASSDSNKTIEYDPTLFRKSRPHSFSPLPSTSKDTETFKKNDELFDESLKEINIPKDPKITDGLLTNDESLQEIKEDEISITKQSTPIKRDDVLITKESTLDKKCVLSKEHTTSKIKDDVLSKKESTLIDDEVQIIEVPYVTIEIEDNYYTKRMRNTDNKDMHTDIIEIIEPVGLEVVQSSRNNKVIPKIPDDEDCMIVTSPETIKNLNNLNEPIVIDDEYSTINLEFDSFHDSQTTEVIDVDDIIAENKSILDKWNNNGAKELNKINKVVEVSTYRNLNTLETLATPRTAALTTSKPAIPSTAVQITSTPAVPSATVLTTSTLAMPSTAVQTTITPAMPSTAVQTTSTPMMLNTTPQAGLRKSVVSPPTTNANKNQNLRNRNIAINNCNISETMPVFHPYDIYTVGKKFSLMIGSIVNRYQTHKSTSNTTMPNRTVNTSMPITTDADNRQRDLVGLGNSSSHSGMQQTSLTIPSPVSPSPEVTRNLGDCPICLDALNSSNGIASTICGHVFCLSCIQASVRSNGKKCPKCRKALKGAGGGYHQLYL